MKQGTSLKVSSAGLFLNSAVQDMEYCSQKVSAHMAGSLQTSPPLDHGNID